jgi:hypothetical protein
MRRGGIVRAACVAAAAFALGGTLPACSQPEAEKMELDNSIEDTGGGAMPADPNEMQMTEEQRRAQEAAQEEALERREFEESGQGDDAPQMP